MKDECGVVGIWLPSKKDGLFNKTVVGLHAIQHRGQEGVGIIAIGDEIKTEHIMGLVADKLLQPPIIQKFESNNNYATIGHVRYSTAGKKNSNERSLQPFYGNSEAGWFAIAHNGNITNFKELRSELMEGGAVFTSDSDSEVFIHAITQARGDLPTRVSTALKRINGAFSLIVLSSEMIIASRDRFGIRPLVVGECKNGGYYFASESCSLDAMQAQLIGNIPAGHLITVRGNGELSIANFTDLEHGEKISENGFLRKKLQEINSQQPAKICLFEYVYFARPDSRIDDVHVYSARKDIGRILAEESAVMCDIVVPVPETSVPVALGYAEAINVPMEYGITKNSYVGRTFIEPTEEGRMLRARLKYNINKELVHNKVITLIDDSIVRGLTSKLLVDLLIEAGAKEVHMRIASPQVKHSCFYGIDTPSLNDLISRQKNPDEIAKIIGAQSLNFISLAGLYKAIYKQSEKFQACDACFTGNYIAGKIEPSK